MLLNTLRGHPRLQSSTVLTSPGIRPSLLLYRSSSSPLSPTRLSPALQCRRHFKILAIETSCDDTCVAVLELLPSKPNFRKTRLLFNGKITSDNVRYGGVHPLRSMESHQKNLAPLIAEAMAKANMSRPDLIAVTKGPGMRNNLQCGIDIAKGLSVAWRVPLMGVHHMQAHALVPRLVNALREVDMGLKSGAMAYSSTPSFPFLSLLVSGGHTLLVHSRSLTEHRILASTTDIAIGDCLDKIARVVIPPSVLSSSRMVSYGALLESFVYPESSHDRVSMYKYKPPRTVGEEFEKGREKNAFGWHFPTPLLTKDGKKFKSLEFSFAGINSHAERIVKYGDSHSTLRESPMDLVEARALAKAAMTSAFEHLASRICLFLESQKAAGESKLEGSLTHLVLGGGVASNSYLKHVLERYLQARGFGNMVLEVADASLCTDNAAMIAWTAAEMVGVTTGQPNFELDGKSLEPNLQMRALRKWSLENLLTPEKEEEREMVEENQRDQRQRQGTREGVRHTTVQESVPGSSRTISDEGLSKLVEDKIINQSQGVPFNEGANCVQLSSLTLDTLTTPEIGDKVINSPQSDGEIDYKIVAPSKNGSFNETSRLAQTTPASSLDHEQPISEVQTESIIFDSVQNFKQQVYVLANSCLDVETLKVTYIQAMRWIEMDYLKNKAEGDGQLQQGKADSPSKSLPISREGGKIRTPSSTRMFRLKVTRGVFTLRLAKLMGRDPDLPSLPRADDAGAVNLSSGASFLDESAVNNTRPASALDRADVGLHLKPVGPTSSAELGRLLAGFQTNPSTMPTSVQLDVPDIDTSLARPSRNSPAARQVDSMRVVQSQPLSRKSQTLETKGQVLSLPSAQDRTTPATGAKAHPACGMGFYSPSS